jgi:hypothetical protein
VQISAPIQPGNSGGPLVDTAGNVVGIVTAQLKPSFSAQNVNFAIKSSVIVAFLGRNGVSTSTPQSTAPLSSADLAERAQRFAVFVTCYRPAEESAQRPQLPSSGRPTSELATLSFFVGSVMGAPGDGNRSLKTALQRALSKRGANLVGGLTTSAYRIHGAVTIGDVAGGGQPIQVEWLVKDAFGRRLGTVTQRNDAPSGSLDGPWGRVADQAADAAVDGIIRLVRTEPRHPPR